MSVFFTDLAGARCLLLFKTDWQDLHRYFEESILDDPSLYVKNPLKAVLPDSGEPFFAEEPKVHIRNGDDVRTYDAREGSSRIIPNDAREGSFCIIGPKGGLLAGSRVRFARFSPSPNYRGKFWAY